MSNIKDKYEDPIEVSVTMTIEWADVKRTDSLDKFLGDMASRMLIKKLVRMREEEALEDLK